MKNSVLRFASLFCESLARLFYGTRKIEYSETISMDGRVKNVTFYSSHYEMRLATPSGYWSCESPNNDFLSYLYVKIPDSYETVFNSACGAVTLLTEEVFKKFENHVGELVTITYREVYKSIYDRRTDELMKCLEVNYEILDVVLK